MDTYLSLMKESYQEKLIRTIIVSNEARVDVFRIHVFEKSLKFDPHFAYGVSKNALVYEMVTEIENAWVEQKIEISEVFNRMVRVLEKYEKYLEQYYFKPDELDFTGRLFTVKPYSVYDNKEYTYFMFKKNKDNLKRINRKEFESNMKSEHVAKSYVENYSMKDATFYNYRITGIKDIGKDCYLMIVGEDLKVGFVNN